MYHHDVMISRKSANQAQRTERVQRIEPARLEDVPEDISNVVAELSVASATLGLPAPPRISLPWSG
jgi:hypothetical protein